MSFANMLITFGLGNVVVFGFTDRTHLNTKIGYMLDILINKKNT